MICLWFVFDLSLICLWFVFDLPLICLWFVFDFVFDLPLIYLWLVFDFLWVSLICLWYVFDLSMICLWFVFDLSSILSLIYLWCVFDFVFDLSLVCLWFVFLSSRAQPSSGTANESRNPGDNQEEKQPSFKIPCKREIDATLMYWGRGNEYGCDLTPPQRGLVDLKLYTRPVRIKLRRTVTKVIWNQKRGDASRASPFRWCYLEKKPGESTLWLSSIPDSSTTSTRRLEQK